jgi:MerR family transcriptional regulator, thiopeptide resistance regulator
MLRRHNTSDVTLTDIMRMFGLTARAARYYEAVGLIETGRDRRNCRTYDATARERLKIIVELRKAGVGIEDIRDVLNVDYDQEAISAAVEKLSLRIAKLEEERAVATKVLQSFGAGLRPGEVGAPRRMAPAARLELRARA